MTKLLMQLNLFGEPDKIELKEKVDLQTKIKRAVLDLVLKHKWYDMIESGEKPEEYRDITPYWRKRIHSGKRYTHVRFHRGYTAKTMMFRYDGLRIGRGNTQWGAPADRDVFIISLG